MATHTVLESVSTMQNEEINCRTFFHIENSFSGNRCKESSFSFFFFFPEESVQKENLSPEECTAEGLLETLPY